MKQVRSLFCLALVVGFVLGQPLLVLAAEHGGTAAAPASGTGSALAPSAGPVAAPAQDDSATLKSAADALRTTNPVLAAQLDDWAMGMGTGDKKATLNSAAAALEASNPDLAAQLKVLAEK